MKTLSIEQLKNLSSQLPEKIPYLKMLVLFGSQARGDTHSKSDWDFAALYDQDMRKKHCEDNPFNYFEVPGILGDIFNLNSDHIDVLEIETCSHRMADRIASDGKLIYEIETGLFTNFQQKSLLTNDAKQVIRQQLKQEINNFLKDWGLIA
jgi:uncharacterized protein